MSAFNGTVRLASIAEIRESLSAVDVRVQHLEREQGELLREVGRSCSLAQSNLDATTALTNAYQSSTEKIADAMTLLASKSREIEDSRHDLEATRAALDMARRELKEEMKAAGLRGAKEGTRSNRMTQVSAIAAAIVALVQAFTPAKIDPQTVRDIIAPMIQSE